MKKLNKNQWIAVIVGVVLVGIAFFGNYFLNIFNGNMDRDNLASALPTSGVEVTDLLVGEGEVASLGDSLTVHYVGALVDGKVFDSSLDSGVPFPLVLGVGQVIRGWDEGLIGMRVGGIRRLVISPDYGYGERGSGPIPPNATLIFEVQLLNVEKQTQ